jgi:hypothetical protein
MFLWEGWIIEGVRMIGTPKTKVYISKPVLYTGVQFWPRCPLLGYNAYCIVVIPYRNFGTTYRPHPQGSLKDFLSIWTSVRIYHYTLRNITEECRSHLFLGGNLKSLKDYFFLMKFRPVGVEMHLADRRTDRHTYMTKLTVAFRNFANAPEKPSLCDTCHLVRHKNSAHYSHNLCVFSSCSLPSVTRVNGLVSWWMYCTLSGLWDMTSVFVGNVNQSVQKCKHLATSGIGNNSVNLFNYKAIRCQCCHYNTYVFVPPNPTLWDVLSLSPVKNTMVQNHSIKFHHWENKLSSFHSRLTSQSITPIG